MPTSHDGQVAVVKKALYRVNDSASVPPRSLEYGYYVVIIYAILGEAWGLSVPLVGAAGLALLASLCVMGRGAKDLLKLVKFPLGCAISILLLHLIVHTESEMPRSFVTWALSLVVTQSLSSR